MSAPVIPLLSEHSARWTLVTTDLLNYSVLLSRVWAPRAGFLFHYRSPQHQAYYGCPINYVELKKMKVYLKKKKSVIDSTQVNCYVWGSEMGSDRAGAWKGCSRVLFLHLLTRARSPLDHLCSWTCDWCISWMCCCLVTWLCLTLVTPWTVACQAPLSVEFPRQEYWSGLPFPSPYMYSIFFVHSSVGRHLDCFCVLAIVNSAAMNIWVHISLWAMFFSR